MRPADTARPEHREHQRSIPAVRTPVYPQRAPFYGQQRSRSNGSRTATQYSQHNLHTVRIPGSPRRQPKRKATFGVGTLVASILAAGLVGGGVATVGSGDLFDTGTPPAVSSSSQTGTVIVNNKDNVNAITAAAVKASPSVVTIKATSGNEGGTGSGIILDDQGHILTNTHVVTLDGASRQRRPSKSGRATASVLKAKVVGTDPLSDLAVIKVDNASGLVPATLGDSSKSTSGTPRSPSARRSALPARSPTASCPR